jgi:hypothetical protein
MDTFTNVSGMLPVAVIAVIALAYMPDRQQIAGFLKKLGLFLLMLILGTALIQHLLSAMPENAGYMPVLALAVISIVAYIIRTISLKANHTERRQQRGIERTPLLPHDLNREDEQ